MDPFDELVARVKEITGLGSRHASLVAADLYDGQVSDEARAQYTAGDIIAAAERLGIEFQRKAGKPVETAPAPEVSMDPATVLAEVYENCPRVLCSNMPAIGKAPAELQQLDPDLVRDLPDEMKALLVKIDLLEGAATFWLRDEANDVDRPIGPIDLNRYGSGEQIRQAFMTLLSRLPRVLSADFN